MMKSVFKKRLHWIIILSIGVVFFIPVVSHWFDAERPPFFEIVFTEGVPSLVKLVFEGLLLALLISSLQEEK